MTMIVDEKKNGRTHVITFDSLASFYDYICNTPLNDSFRWYPLSSVNGTERFTNTRSFDHATELFKNGWDDMSAKLTQELKNIEHQVQPSQKPRSVYDVQGFQACVPRYIQGIPTNMIGRKNVPIKQKVITLNKFIAYSCGVRASQIEEESIKALQIVKKLEAQGYRVNLNIVEQVSSGGFTYCLKIRIKSSTEKLNISKVAFPLVHPSMLRRLVFRFVETYPAIPASYCRGYGMPHDESQVKENLGEHEYLLPRFIYRDINSINTLEDLERL